jgi:hypothetical protein
VQRREPVFFFSGLSLPLCLVFFSPLHSPSTVFLFHRVLPLFSFFSLAFIGQRPCAGNGQLDNVCRGMTAMTYAP